MPLLELVDETYVAVEAQVVAAAVHDPATWAVWWPDLVLTPFMDRGVLGVRWSAEGRSWVGSVELWLEAVADGVLVHHYQRLDPVSSHRAWSARAVSHARDARARAWKLHAFALKDALEGARRPGCPVHPDGSSTDADLPTLGG